MSTINAAVKGIRDYVCKNYGAKASEVLRKMSLYKALSQAMECTPYVKESKTKGGWFLFHINKDYEMNGVSIKDAIVWHSSRERPLDKLLDEFLDAFRSRNAHYTSFDFADGCGSCTLKTNVPYYDTDDELKMQCVLAGTWVDIETA